MDLEIATSIWSGLKTLLPLLKAEIFPVLPRLEPSLNRLSVATFVDLRSGSESIYLTEVLIQQR